MDPPEIARRLFAPIAPTYEKWASLLGMGQDGRWRRVMVDGLDIGSGRIALDVAAGTGSITRLLDDRGWVAVPLDQSREMLRGHRGGSLPPVAATGERLPFPDACFDTLTFGYLLRYVEDVGGCLSELTRVLRPGGQMGMVEFARPRGVWGPLWVGYTGVVLPTAGRLIGSGWEEVGRFLRDSIEDFDHRWPAGRLAEAWEQAGLVDVRSRRLSLGGGFVMWGVKL